MFAFTKHRTIAGKEAICTTQVSCTIALQVKHHQSTWLFNEFYHRLKPEHTSNTLNIENKQNINRTRTSYIFSYHIHFYMSDHAMQKQKLIRNSQKWKILNTIDDETQQRSDRDRYQGDWNVQLTCFC